MYTVGFNLLFSALMLHRPSELPVSARVAQALPLQVRDLPSHLAKSKIGTVRGPQV
jgi:hypothetical protein